MNDLKIQKPCTENWANMSPTEKGAFCQQCCKQVIDFTKQTPEEIRSILFQNAGEEVCARVGDKQLDELNQDFQAWRQSNSWSMQRVSFYAILFVFGLSIVSCARHEDEQHIQQVQQKAQSILQKNVQNTIPPKMMEELAQPEVQTPPEVEAVQELEEITCVLDEEAIATIPERTEMHHMLGGVGYSPLYREYLQEIVPLEQEEEIKLDENGNQIPTEFNAIAFPNPTNGKTTLKIELPSDIKTNIMVYGMDGSLRTISDRTDLKAGTHEIPFDLSAEEPGTYLITIHSEEFKESVRVIKL